MHIWKIRQKSFIIFGNCAKSLEEYTEIMEIFELFYFYEAVSEYAKIILACTGNTLKVIKLIRRIRHK